MQIWHGVTIFRTPKSYVFHIRSVQLPLGQSCVSIVMKGEIPIIPSLTFPHEHASKLGISDFYLAYVIDYLITNWLEEATDMQYLFEYIH